MISGLWANTNYDDEKNSRQKALTTIEESYQEAINNIYNGSIKSDEEYKKELDQDPLFAAMSLD